MLVLGDAHASNRENQEFLARAYSDTNEEYALQVGDLLCYTLPQPTWFIAGNNEDFDRLEPARTATEPRDVGENSFLLNGNIANITGLTITGLSGNYAPTQFERQRTALVGERRRHFTHEDIERLLDLKGTAIDILLTHEAPHNLITSKNYNVGCPHIDTLIEELRPNLCLVGHHHEHAEHRISETKVISLAPVWEGFYILSEESLSLRFESWNESSLSEF